MTRIGVFSDSHGDRDALERLLEEMGHVDAACFLGDISSDAMFLRESATRSLTVRSQRTNNGYPLFGQLVIQQVE